MEKLKVKILGISASNRPNMNTAWLVRYALKAAEKVGKRVMDIVDLETEFLDIADKEIKPCLNCEKECMTNEGLPYRGKPRPPIAGCPIKDYMSEVIMPKMKEADGYVYGSPVYTTSFTSKYRLFTERFSSFLVKES